MNDVVEDIWSNFNEGEGPCDQCPNRDKSRHWTPFYGGGSKEAELAFVAITPGDDRPQQIGNESQVEQVPDQHSELDQWHVNSGAKMYSRFLRPVLNSVFQFESDVEYILREHIYYTNGKKCADIDPNEDDIFESKSKLAEYKNARAYLHCNQYLRPEIEFVDPEVIVTVGQKPWKALCKAFARKPTGKFAKEHALKQHEIAGYCVIPSYHWNRLGTNYKHVEEPLDSENDYLQRLGLEISRAFRERGVPYDTEL